MQLTTAPPTWPETMPDKFIKRNECFRRFRHIAMQSQKSETVSWRTETPIIHSSLQKNSPDRAEGYLAYPQPTAELHDDDDDDDDDEPDSQTARQPQHQPCCRHILDVCVISVLINK
jgi:hypothetical protein